MVALAVTELNHASVVVPVQDPSSSLLLQPLALGSVTRCHLPEPSLLLWQEIPSIFPLQTLPAVLVVLPSAKGYKIHLFAKKAT